jgi:hypothetical protein
MARKIETAMVQTLRTLNVNRSGIVFSRDNTTVEIEHHGTYLTPSYEMIVKVKLHGSVICRYNRTLERVTFSDCGYQTATTKSRLNALLEYFSAYINGGWSRYGIFQSKHVWYLQESSLRYTGPGKDSHPFVPLKPVEWPGELTVSVNRNCP